MVQGQFQQELVASFCSSSVGAKVAVPILKGIVQLQLSADNAKLRRANRRFIMQTCASFIVCYKLIPVRNPCSGR